MNDIRTIAQAANSSSTRLRRRLPGVVIATLLLTLASSAQASNDLVLEVQDATVLPGGVAAISIRTFLSRPISQGQLCLRTPSGAAASPLTAINDSEVFSGQGDAMVPTLTLTGDEVMIEFESASATINEDEGPLLVLYTQVRGDLGAGASFPIEVDLLNSGLLDDDGQPLPIAPVNATLTIADPLDDLEIEAEGEDGAYPGGTALISIETDVVVGWSSARFDLTYPEEIADAAPTVFVDPRYGNATVETTDIAPGELEIVITSPDGSLNTLPGDVVQITFPVRSDTMPGTFWTVSINPATAQVLDAEGMVLGLEFDAEPLEVGFGELFDDDFEDGDTGNWTIVSP